MGGGTAWLSGVQKMMSRAYLFFLSISLAFFPVVSYSYDAGYRGICALNKGADFSGRYRLVSAERYCTEDDCDAVKYVGMQGEGERKISFVSSARLDVDREYFIFFWKAKLKFFPSPWSAERMFPVPKGVQYFVPIDSAFLIDEAGDIYRDLPPLCFGGEGCDVVSSAPRDFIDKISMARVYIKDFYKTKDECSKVPGQ